MLEEIRKTSGFLERKISSKPDICVVLGSGLGAFADSLEKQLELPYSEIPGFHSTTVIGHAGRLIYGKVSKKNVLVLQGRCHGYEGHSMGQVALAVRSAFFIGTKTFILTNAAGGINPSYRPGNLMLINDHINLMGDNPLIGPHVPEFGPRFPDLSKTYSPRLLRLFRKVAKEHDIDLKEGVYAGLRGPAFETPAEVRMLRTMGADAVGMSTVPESIALSSLGAEIAGVSCISNLAAGLSEALNHEEVIETTKHIEKTFIALLHGVIANNA
ncbi:MAG: purine-nucleoside phosphorylase [Bacteriovoracia bacterium]